MTLNPLSPDSSDTKAGTGVHLPSRFTPIDPIRLLRQHVWLLVISVVLSVAIGGGLWYALRRFAPQYTSTTQLNITGGINDPYQLVQRSTGGGFTGMGLMDAFIKNQTVRIRSNEILEGALRRDDVRGTEWFKALSNKKSDQEGVTQDDIRRIRTAMNKALSARRISGSTLIQVGFTCGNEKDPPLILDAIVNVYLDKLAFETGSESDSVRRTFVRERDRAEENLDQIKEQMRQFTIQNDLPAIESRNNEISISYQLLAEEQAKIQVAYQSAREMYTGLLSAQRAGNISYSQQQLAQVELDPLVTNRRERLWSLREQRQVLLERFGEKHRVVREIDLQIIATEQEKKREIDRLLRKIQAVKLEESKNMMDSLLSQLETMRPKIEEVRLQLRDLGLKIEEYRRLESRADAAAGRRARAEELLNSMRLQSDRPDAIQVRQVVSATEAELSFPKVLIIVPGMVLLLTGSIAGIVTVKEALDQRIKTPRDMQLLPQCRLLGVIPDGGEDPSNPIKVEGVVRTHPTGLMAESYRQVRSALLTEVDQHQHKTILVVGAQPYSGTSVVVNNLAVSIAYDGRRVLVLDANFRRPTQHKIFNTPAEPGLIEVLGGLAALEQVVVQLDEPAVDVLPIGRVADAMPEIFERGAFDNLLSQLKARYDVVLIDVPPALLTSDSSAIAKHVDAIVMVVRALEDKRGMVSRMFKQLGGNRARVLGAILNGVRTSAGGYFRKNYQAFYRYQQSDTHATPRADSADIDQLEAAADER